MTIDIAGNGWAVVVDPAAPRRSMLGVHTPERKHKAFSDGFDDRFWINRRRSLGRWLPGWYISVPVSWWDRPGAEVQSHFSVICDRFEDALALVRLGVDTDKTTYLAVVGQLVQVRDDVRLAA